MFVQLKDFPDYAVTDDGRVISFKRGKWRELRPKFNRHGYAIVTIMHNKKQFTKTVHRLVMCAFNGKSELKVNHKNGIKKDNALGNLEFCTQRDNVRHSIRTGLRKYKVGEGVANSKITNEQALSILQLRSNTQLSYPKISAMTGISIHIVKSICAGTSWSAITGVHYAK